MTANWDGTPKTWSTGELVTATDLNAEVRDRMEYLKLRIVEDAYIHIRDEKTLGTEGGTFTAGAWQTRDLTTEVSDAGGYASLASNQITLAAGTYWARILLPAYTVTFHQGRLQNVSDGTTLLLGMSSTANTASAHTVCSEVIGLFTLAAEKTLEVQHRCSTTKTTNGFGKAASLDTEVYTIVELIRIGD